MVDRVRSNGLTPGGKDVGTWGDPKPSNHEPRIREVGDFTVIGVRSHKSLLEQKVGENTIDRIMDIVGGADYLILEGTRAGHEFAAGRLLLSANFEVHAYWNFKNRDKKPDIHYLEEEDSPTARLLGQGVDPQLTIVNLGFSEIVEAVKERRESDDFSLELRMRELAERMKKLQPRIYTTVDEVYGYLITAANGLAKFEQTATEADKFRLYLGENTFTIYNAWDRDARPITEMLHLLRTILPPGKKVIMVGEGHVDNVVRILNDQPVPRMYQYDIFKDKLNQERREGIELFECVATGFN